MLDRLARYRRHRRVTPEAEVSLVVHEDPAVVGSMGMVAIEAEALCRRWMALIAGELDPVRMTRDAEVLLILDQQRAVAGCMWAVACGAVSAFERIVLVLMAS